MDCLIDDDKVKIIDNKLNMIDEHDNPIEKEFQNEIDEQDNKLLFEFVVEEEDSKHFIKSKMMVMIIIAKNQAVHFQ